MAALTASDGNARGDLVEGRVRHRIGVHLRRALQHIRHGLQHLGIGAAGIGLRGCFVVPHTDTHRCRAAWDDERNLVLEAWLLAQQGNDVVFKRAGKLCNAIGLQLHAHRTSKHVSLLDSEGCVRADDLKQ